MLMDMLDWLFPKKVEMKVELLMVVEIGYDDEHLLTPYAAGSRFCRPSALTDDSLLKVVTEHLEEFIRGEWAAHDICSLFGGYVLRVDGRDELFPQCCGTLSDISFWTRVVQGKKRDLGCDGHPCPTVRQRRAFIDLICDDEEFRPETKGLIRIDRSSLAIAVAGASRELAEFHKRVVSTAAKLGLGEMAKRLTYGV